MGKPVFLYDNRLAATVAASTTATGYAAANVIDWRPYTWWKPTALPATLTQDCGAAAAADYALVYGHDLATHGCAIDIRGSTDNFVASNVLLDTHNAADSGAILRLFGSASYRYWRLRIRPRNALLFSEQFDNAAWTKGGASISANATTAPDGATTADKLVEDTSTGSHTVLVNNFPVIANTTHTFSAYVKAAERVSGRIDVSNGGNTSGFRAYFNLTDGTVSLGTAYGTGTYSGASIQDVGDGWYRVSVTGVVDSSSTTTDLFLLLDNNTDGSSVSYTGDGASGFYVWGAQFEESSSASTYFATGSAHTMPSLAIAAIGAKLEPTTWLLQGFDPIGRTVESSTNRNANGQPLGRVIDYERWQQTITLQSVSWSWLRNTFEPAWESHLRSSPFGFCWEPDSYAAEVRLVVAGDKVDTPHRSGLLADLSIELSGVVE